MTDLKALENALGTRMDAYRLSHTIAVKEECLRLATLFDLSDNARNSIAAAALLHDCTKGLKYSEQLSLAKQLGITLSADDLASPKVLHSITGAAVAKTEFGASHEIAAMIACHTTGKEDMTLSEKLLYLADYIEPTRTFDDCIRLRKFFYESKESDLLSHLNRTLLLSFDLTIQNLLAEHSHIHIQTIKSRNFLLKNA